MAKSATTRAASHFDQSTADTAASLVEGQLREEWLEQLAADDEAAEFPADRSRPASLGLRCHRAERPVGDLIQGARYPVETLIAAWAVFFARASGYKSVMVAEHDGDHRKGSLLNVSVGDHPSMADLIASLVQARQAEAERGAVSFADLANALGLPNRADRNPLCSTMVGPSPQSETSTIHGDLTIADLQLQWTSAGAYGISTIEVVASAALFEPDRVERIADEFVTLLGSATASPDQHPDHLTWVPSYEMALMASWQGSRREPDDPLLGRRFTTLASQWSDQVAVTFEGSDWSYGQLETWSNRLAHDLRQRGIGPDSIVAIRMGRSIELIGSILAVLKAGGGYLPVDPTYPPVRQRHMLDHAQVSLILTDSTTGPTDGDNGATTIDVTRPDAAFHQLSGEPVSPRGDGSELGYVIFTSGSTGTPKAVGMPVGALANLMDWQLDQPEFQPGRRTLQFSSPSFDVSFQEIMSTLLSGGTLVLIDDTGRRDSGRLHQHIVDHAVERIFLPNVALRGLAEVAANSGTAAKLPLREVYTAGEQLRVDEVMRSLFQQLPDCRLANHYGPSETHVATAHVLSRDASSWPVLPPIGGPIANSVAEVLDPSGQRVPIGVPGELWLGGRCLARGYLGNPEGTAERFVPDPFRPGEPLYRTGDQVKWTDQGELEFLGRLDHQVKFRGFRIEPEEIAAVLSTVEGVNQCFVAVRDVAAAGARLVAYIQVDDPTVGVGELRRRATEILPDYMVPTHYVPIDTVPLTSSGKVDLDGLPTPSFDRRVLETEFVPPGDAVEEAIQSIWESLLGIDTIGVVDDFFDLGGDSLMAVELFALIEERFGIELPLGALARQPTIRGVAAQVARAGVDADDFAVIVPIRTGGERNPLFCVHGGSGNVASFPRLARLLDPDQPFYGLQWPGLRYGDFPQTMAALAAHYVDKIRAVQPNGPYRLSGQCIGGLIAHEMARQLVEAGHAVDFVVLYDSPMLYSPDYHPKASLPAVPSWLQPAAMRALSGAVGLRRLLRGGSGFGSRTDVVKTRMRRLLRRRVPRPHLFLHGASVMCGIAWRHRPPVLDGVRTVLIHSGLDNAGEMALTGRWTDDTLGWRHREGAFFTAHRVPGGHNELLYSAESVAILQDLLDS